MEIEIDFVALFLHTFGEVEIVCESVGAVDGVDPLTESHAVHAAVAENGFGGSCGVVFKGVFEDGAALFEHEERG